VLIYKILCPWHAALSVGACNLLLLGEQVLAHARATEALRTIDAGDLKAITLVEDIITDFAGCHSNLLNGCGNSDFAVRHFYLSVIIGLILGADKQLPLKIVKFLFYLF
jgi:hypothetical protein